MRRTVLLSVVVLLCVAALGTDSPKEYDGEVVWDDLQGAWAMVSKGTCRGPNEWYLPGAIVQTFRGGRWATSAEGQATSEGVYTIDKSRTPASLNITETKGKDAGHTLKLIYRLDGDTLRIGSGPGNGQQRPTNFEDAKVQITILKRVKK